MRGVQGVTKKQKEVEYWENVWLLKAKQARAQEKTNAGGFDQRRHLRGPELSRTLEHLHELTGDPVFEDALLAVRSYGIDSGRKNSSLNEFWGNARIHYLHQVKYIIDKSRGRKSVPEASRQIAAERFILAASFQEAWDLLARDFRDWRKAGYPEASINVDTGNLGYMVNITAPDGSAVPAQLIPQGNDKRFSTLYWRRLYREGAIAMSFCGNVLPKPSG